MSDGVGWKTVELQIEVLVPGIILAFELNILAPNKIALQTWLLKNEFIMSAVFIAVSYSLGVVASILSRAIVDGLSERGPRAWVYSYFAHANIDNLFKECKTNDPKFDGDFVTEKMRRCREKIAMWNAVYRSALRRTTRKAEVDRRRSQGRLMRNLFFPMIFAPLLINDLGILWFLCAFLIVVVITFLYAYSEYVSFAEAYDISVGNVR